ncbi:hypothetical protein F5050DRAFT_1828343 [Lentinula boryana]|uniref:PARP catalytic domain-containing protein n=1 Tax=Lentinula boryana TaxID=40481 RepID=A0ABQ8Q9Y3_9AGAR|nr:hypothetical protein F5050DRAFT_1828343 [Lentinula boryana]
MVAMDASDLIQLPHFSLSDEQPYLESDGEDQLLFTPIPDRACGFSYLDSVSNTAQDCLGVTPTQICNNILPEYRVVHVESIIRKDLSRRFLEFRDQLRSKLMQLPLTELRKFVPPDQQHVKADHEEDFVEYMEYIQVVKPKLTFYESRLDLVPSIVQYGFLKPGSTHPGTDIPLPVRNGSTYGRGIYSSPSSAFSLAFSGPQQNLGVFPARIVGLRYNHGPPCTKDADRKLEGPEQTKYGIRFTHSERWTVPGKSIVIEDIADIEDDEEDYQTNRLDDVQKSGYLDLQAGWRNGQIRVYFTEEGPLQKVADNKR